jgi:UDP-GlcNAc:undecaprenyl-phosphate/decaprenyl-phosphate GlcNAc-1-phosphate transferase
MIVNSAFIFALISVAVGVALLLCTNAQSIGRYFALLDIPDQRKRHRNITPLMGGLVVLLAMLPTILTYYYWVGVSELVFTLLVAACGVLTLLGIYDDRNALAVMPRLLVSAAVFAGIGLIEPVFNVRWLNFSFGLGIGMGTFAISLIFTTTCCVGLLNALNLVDGKNGLLLGLCIGWLGIILFRVPNEMVPAIVITIAILLVLLAFNLAGRLFLGDGGAYGLGCFVALVVIITYNQPGSHGLRAIAADEVALLFLVPIGDMFRLMAKRIWQKRSPFSADRDHLHHYIEARYGWGLGLPIYLVLALAPSAVAIGIAT